MRKITVILFGIFELFAFGQNKIQYKDFKWEMVESPHFRIYYSEGGSPLASFAIPVLENAYDRISTLFSMELEGKTPVIIYNSPNDFRQTNVTLSLIEEGVGGFTEIYKNRVVVPFDGSYESFRHVLEHELTHVFEFQLFYGGVQGLAQGTIFQAPLFIMEGLAEYISLKFGSETQGFVKDLLLNDLFPSLTELENYGGYIVYKVGHAFFYFISSAYGEEKISEFLYQLKNRKTMSGASEKVFGLPIDELSKKFSFFLKKKLYESIEASEFPSNISRRLTNHTRTGGFLNVGPALSLEGDLLVFLSDRTSYTDIYLLSISGSQKPKKIISGERLPSLENLHLLRPGIAFSPSGSLIVFTSSGEGKDNLNFYDLETNKVTRHDPIDLNAVYTPVFIQERRLVFVGIKDGMSDLYEYDLLSREIFPLTKDWFEEKDPVFLNGYLYFVSDKNEDDRYGSYAIFRMNLRTGEMERLTPYLGNISKPFPLDSVKVAFLYGNSEGQNIYLFDIKKDSFYQVTNFPTHIREVSYSRKSQNGKKIVLSLLWEGGYDLFFISDLLKQSEMVPVSLKEIEGRERKKWTGKEEWKSYSSGFSVDWVQGSILYSPQFDYFGSVGLAASDALGNLRIIFFTDVMGQDLTNSNWILDLYYLPKRVDYLFSFYQFFPLLPLSTTRWAVQRNLGAFIGLLIPLNRFFRFELGPNVEYVERFFYDYIDGAWRYDTLGGDYFVNPNLYGGMVFDRSSYFYPGVRDGERIQFGIEQGISPDVTYTKFIMDFRKYFRLTKRSNFAIRLFAGGKEGSERAPPFWLGGRTTLRGYNLFEFVGSYAFMTNFELRTPFLDFIKLSFPLPLELGGIRGVFFLDAGGVFETWESARKFQPFERTDGFFRTKDLLLDVGWGLRWDLGLFLLKFDVARKFDFTDFRGHTMYWINFGQDF